MFTWLSLFQLSSAELHLTDVKAFQDQPADALDILLDKTLLRIEQFQISTERNLTQDEQIVWHINSLLPQPLENYFYAYQVYVQEENQVQGLFCVIEKSTLTKFTSITNQRLKIYSADKQFLLYENKVPPWQIESYLRRLLSLSKILFCCIVGLSLFALPALFFWQQQLSKESTAFQTEKQNLLRQLKKIQAYERAQNLAQKDSVLNQKISAYLYAFSLQLPERVYFRKLLYAGQTVQIDGYCTQDKELKALQKALKTDSSLKPEIARLSKEDFIYFSLRVDLKKLLEKEIKNVQK